ncbi:MAG: DUF3822 family protein, partial [Ginsengibacter sp.]
EDKMITGLSVYNFEKKNDEDNVAKTLRKIFDEQYLLKEEFNEIFISCAFDESILTPKLYYNANQSNDNLNLMYGDLHPGVVLTDHVAERNLYNVYRITNDIHKVITNQYKSVTFFHQYSLLIRKLQPAGNILKLIFYNSKIVISLQKAGKLQIIQAFKYITANDAVYHMLNVCTRFDAKDVSVQLGGMIEKDSTLFTEIQKYFLTTTFSDLPGGLLYTDEIKEFPTHFFSHLFAFALCV